jgi:DNA 3'-phosphatase
LYVLNSGIHSTKIAAFDMDHTLVYPKSGAKFAKNRNDWAWWHPSVVPKLQALHKDNYKVVIFTNQAGIEKKNTKAGDITGKVTLPSTFSFLSALFSSLIHMSSSDS